LLLLVVRVGVITAQNKAVAAAQVDIGLQVGLLFLLVQLLPLLLVLVVTARLLVLVAAETVLYLALLHLLAAAAVVFVLTMV
jgi:hypothetical protein